MVEELNYVFYCKKCGRLRKVFEGYHEKAVIPEQEPKFDVVTWCCTICKEPLVEVTAPTSP